MGLDMYLWQAEKSGLESGQHPTASYDKCEQVAYWRKANAVHGWFVERVQNGEDECEPFIVRRELLADLLKSCDAVRVNPDAAPYLLPTQDGFFFGSTEYGEMYREDIDLTISQCREILETFDFRRYDLVYWASW